MAARADATHLELSDVAALCTLAGEAYPFDDPGPVGSADWHRWACTVLAVAHNTRVITTDTRNALIVEAFEVARAAGGVR